MKLNQLHDNPGARKSRTRICRGIGSGKGKTGGAGVKGQKARTGVAIKGFEGGQMPLYIRLPKRGFTNIFAKHFVEVTLERLQAAIDAKKVDAKQEINADVLCKAGVVRRIKDGVRLVARGELTSKISIEVAGASKGALEAVEKVGGKVTLLAAPKKEASA